MSLFACVREPPVLMVRHNALSIAAAVCFKKYALVSRERGKIGIIQKGLAVFLQTLSNQIGVVCGIA